jgi:hypothetical protein
MTDMLSKPDAAHRRQLELERKLRLVMRSIWATYFAGGLVTLAIRLFMLANQCHGVVDCGVGSLKALAWAVLWPFCWMFYTNGSL